jgi:hypothetical protein
MRNGQGEALTCLCLFKQIIPNYSTNVCLIGLRDNLQTKIDVRHTLGQ